MITPNSYIISDTHFGHNNIIGFCDRPLNHEDVIIANWRNTVGEYDPIFHLGDVAFGNKKNVYDWAKMIYDLPGVKYLIKGNHDHSSSMKIYKGIFRIIEPFVQDFSGTRIYFSHYPDHPTTEQWDINIHGHIHNNPLHSKFTPNVNPNKIYRNVSVEVTNYTPILLSSILSELGVPF